METPFFIDRGFSVVTIYHCLKSEGILPHYANIADYYSVYPKYSGEYKV